MLVINSNNQQDTTNFMLADPQYPDVNQILMRGWPKWVYSATGNVTMTVSFPVLETINGIDIHHFCQKIYKYNLWLINSSRTHEWYTTVAEVQPDIWLCGQLWWSWNYTVTVSGWHIIYTIAVSWLKEWHIVWENIFAPLLFFNWQNMANNWIVWTGVSVDFKLLHKDGTNTNITTISLSRQWWTASADICNTRFTNVYNTAYWFWSYHWQWQETQNDDILIATVDMSITSFMQALQWCSCGLLHSGANPNMRDLYGFRPFQVSIR